VAVREGTVEKLELTGQFGGAYAGLDVLVTGHTGFKGSWLCAWLGALGARVCGLALPAETRPSHWELLSLAGVGNHVVDLRDADAVRGVFASVRPRLVFHLAAQPLVRRSYREPVATYATNVSGLVNLFEAVRTCGSVQAVVNATTDKVYRPLDPPRPFREDDPLGGHDPYSASKACAELVSESYRESFLAAAGIRLATARAGNVIGGGDWSEDRLVPDFVRAATAGEPLRLRRPDAVRPWQHVLEPLSGYLRLGQALLAGEPVEGAWNFGPSDDGTISVQALAGAFRDRWPGSTLACDPGPHPHEATQLRLDCAKAHRDLGWRPVWSAATTVARTVAWYRAQAETGRLLTGDDVAHYSADARAAGLGWAT
jgi:CDP-glucose 4,6-dehydratase